jgi:outer membrane protein assembly factor BamD
MFEHDFSIGRFYYKTKKYWAAKGRFTDILSQYDFISNRDEVLYYLAMSYRHLNDETKAQEVLVTLVREFPQSLYGQEAQAALNSATGAEVAQENTFQPDKR